MDLRSKWQGWYVPCHFDLECGELNGCVLGTIMVGVLEACFFSSWLFDEKYENYLVSICEATILLGYVLGMMIAEMGQCDFDHPSASFWKDTYNEYGGAVLFHRLCRQVRSV